MTEARARPRAIAVIRTVALSPITVWIAFVLVHLWLGMLNLYGPGYPLGDVTTVYRHWLDQALVSGYWVGIDTAFVYPILALVPMLVASVFGQGQLAGTWLSMILLLDAVAFGFVTGWGRAPHRVPVAWWWVAFLLALGPIAMGRIDAVTVPIAMVGVLLLATRPRTAAVILTIATWIKVWPAALLAAAFIALHHRWRIVAAAALTSAAIAAVSISFGGGAYLFSFVTEQAGRGLQVESPVATIWMWQALAKVPGTFVYYDQQILTYQVQGTGVDAASAIMTPVLAVAVLVVVLLGWRATRAGAAVGDLLPPLALALVTVFIAFNKVGSPQFISWLAVPIVLGLATSAAGYGRSFRTPAILALVLAVLTQVLYPYLYFALVSLDPMLVVALTARNVLLFVVLGWAVHAVIAAARLHHEETDEEWLPSVWPLDAHHETIDKTAGEPAANR